MALDYQQVRDRIAKEQPGTSDVHVSSAGGTGKKPKAKLYAEIAARNLGKADAAPLYVRRNLTNAKQLHQWATDAGIPNIVPPHEMHVTQVYSKTPVVLAEKLANTVKADGDARSLGPLGDQGAVVLHFDSQALRDRHADAMEQGASHDWGTYKPHVTLSYDADGFDLCSISPPSFPLDFGPEVHEPINEEWAVEQGLRKFVKAESVDASLGMVFGWAIVCKEDGKEYWDVQKNHIPEHAMLEASCDFMENSRAGNEMHAGPDKGTYLFAFPLTTEIAKAMKLTTARTGLMIGYKPPADVLAKFVSGEYTGFSIEGQHIDLVD